MCSHAKMQTWNKITETSLHDYIMLIRLILTKIGRTRMCVFHLSRKIYTSRSISISISRVIPRGMVRMASCNLMTELSKNSLQKYISLTNLRFLIASIISNTYLESLWEEQSKFEEYNIAHRSHPLPAKSTKRKNQWSYIHEKKNYKKV